jgi:hypothetical protein
MKKTVLNEFFVYEFPCIEFEVAIKKVEPVLENKNSDNNATFRDNYNKLQKDRHYYGKRRRYYSDYI